MYRIIETRIHIFNPDLLLLRQRLKTLAQINCSAQYLNTLTIYDIDQLTSSQELTCNNRGLNLYYFVQIGNPGQLSQKLHKRSRSTLMNRSQILTYNMQQTPPGDTIATLMSWTK